MKLTGFRGGKNELSVRDAANQSSSDPSVRALLKTWKQGLPIVLIADDNYRSFPYSLKPRGFGYAVLGTYTIVEAWRALLELCLRKMAD